MLRQYLAAGAQGDAAPSCESSIARHQGRGFRPAGTHRSLHAASQVALSGKKLPARGLPGWLPSWFARGHKHVSIWKQIVDNQNTLLTIVGLVTGAVFSVETLLRGRRDAERAQRDSERAQRESKEGRIQAAVDGMMQPLVATIEEAHDYLKDAKLEQAFDQAIFKGRRRCRSESERRRGHQEGGIW